MKQLTMVRFAPWLAAAAVVLATVVLAFQSPAKVRGFDVAAFGRLPILKDGRVKPMDSMARNLLLLIHGKQTLRASGRELSADAWLLDVLYKPEIATQQPLFQVDDPDVLSILGRTQTADRYVSWAEMEPHLKDLSKQGEAAMAVESKRRNRFERNVLTLFERVTYFHRLANSVHLWDGASLSDEIANRAKPNGRQDQGILVDLALFRPLAPLPGQPADAWRSMGERLRETADGPVDPRLNAWAKLEASYRADAAWGFNDAVAELESGTRADRPDAVAKVDREVVFNQVEPFYLGMEVYVAAMLLVFVSWLWPTPVLPALAFGLLSAGFAVHTGGLLTRIWLEGRPPVTNLYSSAVFIGWVVVLLGLLLQRVYRRSFATAIAAAVGFTTLLIAHHLGSNGEDTMEMMRAVLDSNFWLGTHVVTVTIGYSGTFLAGAIAVGYALRRQLIPVPDKETSRALLSMTYGVLCFSLFFSFVGTVLGGIWADQSWGRFWGWDPKENGALLIVLWNGIILHARMGGFVREKGLMAMAIFGNVITSWSWFGVNMLGVGLHSYGFTDNGQFVALASFMVAQLVLMAACLAPPLAPALRALGGGPTDSGKGPISPELGTHASV